MKTLNIIIGLVITVVIFSSCRKEVVQPTVPTSNKPQNISELTACASFDWKTTKDYHFAFTGQFNEVVTIKSASGVVFHKGFMKANTAYNLNLTLPASEKVVHLIYHNADIVYNLTQANASYTFNSK